MTLVDITAQLEQPFPLEDIELLPKGQVERDSKTLCMAMPYADVRVYQDRLNKLAPGEWSTPPPLALVVGTKLVCYVTIVIYGVSHTDVGEAGPGENQGTEAFAQAFKRAASQFGLGRYLYNLEKAWVPYNPQRKQINLDANGIKAIVWQMYQKAGVSFSQNGNVPKTPENGNDKATVEAGQPAQQNGNGHTPLTVASLREKAKGLGLDERKFRKAVCNVLKVEEFPKEFSTADLWKISNALDAAAAKQSAGGGR
jgi:hypothetical protein